MTTALLVFYSTLSRDRLDRLHYLGRGEFVLANHVPDLSGGQVANFVVWHAMLGSCKSIWV